MAYRKGKRKVASSYSRRGGYSKRPVRGRSYSRQRVEVVIRQEPTNSGAYAGDGVAVTKAPPAKRRRF